MITLSQKGEGRPFQLSEADHLDAFAYLSETKLLQGSACCELELLTCLLYSSKETKGQWCPSPNIFIQNAPKRTQNVTKFEDIWSSLPATMVGCDESIAQTSQSHGSYMEVCPFGHHMLGTNWAQMEFVLLWVTVIKCHRKCSMKMTDLLVTTMTLMMNAWHFLRMKVNKIEGPLTHAVNAQINTIWWLIFHNV